LLLSQTLLSAMDALNAQSVFLSAVAVLACILGVEIAGICILLSKLLHARKQKRNGNDQNRLYAIAPVALFFAIGTAGTVVLAVLAVMTVVASVALVVLLGIVRACGYEVVSAKASAKKAEPATDSVEDALDVEAADFVMPEESEEQRQEAYTESPEDPFAFVEEESFEEEEYFEESEDEEPDTEEVEAVSEEEPIEEAVTDEEPAEVSAESEEDVLDEAPAESAAAPISDAPPAEPATDPAQPYKVVEKIVTETVKEIYKENPPSETQPTVVVSESVVEKLVDLLDYEIRSRRDAEQGGEEKSEQSGRDESVATFVATELPDDEEDEEDEVEDAEDAKGDDDEDRDEEENEIEDDRFTGNERIIGFDEATGCYIVAHYRKSFEAKLIQARPNIKQYYSELKNALLSYKGTKSRISWTADSFHNGRTPIAKINVKTRILELYLAIDPASLEGTVYRGQDVSNKKKYADTPFRYKLRTPRKFKWAMELVQRVCEEKGLSPIDIERVDYEAQYPFDTTENLVERKLIKEYIRQEKPATTFELDPDHVPAVPSEDDSVIPANANFSWEFDNERMEEKEREPEVVPVPEAVPEAAEEPNEPIAVVQVPEEAPSAEPAPILRETVKVTEVRYTERYYNGSEPVYEQEVITSDSVEAAPTGEDGQTQEQEACSASVALQSVIELAEEQTDADDAVPEADEPAAEEELAAEEESEEERFFAEIENQKHEVIFADNSSYTTEDDALYEEEPVAEEIYEEEPATEEIYEEEPVAEEYYEEEPVAEEIYEEEPVAEEYYEEEPATEEIYEEEPVAEEYYEEEPIAEEYYEEEPIAEEYYFDQESNEQLYVAAEDDGDVYFEEIVEEVTEEPEEPEPEDVPEEQPVYEAAAASKFNPSVAVIDICSVEAAFAAGEVISLDSLKEKGLVLTGVTTLKIYATDTLSKPFTVEANHFTMEAIQIISAANGDIIMVR